MAKWMKKLLGLAAIGSAAAGLVYYFKKSKKDVDEDFNDDSILTMIFNRSTGDTLI